MKRALVILLATAIAAPALAADLPLRPAPKAKQEMPAQKMKSDFDALGADCVEASDGCRRFARGTDNLFGALNNIGIACQPQPLSCTKRR